MNMLRVAYFVICLLCHIFECNFLIAMKASTPNKRPSPITEDPPPPAAFRKPAAAAGSVLESKVISSIIQHNESSFGNSRSAHNSPIKPGTGSGGRCTSAMETLVSESDLIKAFFIIYFDKFEFTVPNPTFNRNYNSSFSKSTGPQA